jgi:hypothetical protein
MWQAPDWSWRPLTLGLEDGWPPPELWPEGSHGTEPDGQAPPADDGERRPPLGDPEDGHL